ncbi:para-aminobenzoate synthase [Metschnikowia bicuspidata var. bicuspidata NRRL YB-4993]|uniref:aminodeoxychorismate synthase n=1 Tax=Metschnikowia bicuspidata var. bicuspidata NRRL YB-4993 TaxID=869754 RepID=A0A1A0HBB0_9ASCO|nr:para-aminobenzoate synthase [Metschnikowia bicuspidata var. bicuspidata NRRL YB-4993]OBA21419.1 para-aminobenzoate synthase [Metschnikowia bicuspidata var. bicuspidata NRRL YB-4993]
MILLIDSYDSFSHNLRRLLEANAGRQVVTIFNDTFAPREYEHAFQTWLRFFDYIVVGPGPGHPHTPEDVGIVGWLFRRFARDPPLCVPTLGVCLGFQSLCLEFGNKVLRLQSIKHGQVYAITPVASALFGAAPEDLEPFASVRYHSLHVEMAGLNAAIVPLATCQETGADAGADGAPRRILMAGRHAALPLYGVQYHPESICSSRGDQLVRNFDRIAADYNRERRAGLRARQRDASFARVCEDMVRRRSVQDACLVPGGTFACRGAPAVFARQFRPAHPGTMPIDVCEHLARAGVDFTFLNSAADPGEWSIIGLPLAGLSEVLSHSVETPHCVTTLRFKTPGSAHTEPVASMWQFLASRMAARYVSRQALEARIGHVHSRPFPFWGGYMGVLSYEEGQHVDTAKMALPCRGSAPDTKLVFVERFILYDRICQSWFLVSIRENDAAACEELLATICSPPDLRIDAAVVPTSVKALCRAEDQHIQYEFPSREVYNRQFDLCQEYLHSGDSYELCLTTQLKIRLPLYLDPWSIYKVLAVHKNPSPYSSFMDFDDCVLISSSPERFLSWGDSAQAPGKKIAELRPIKGTVKNTDAVTLDDATAILRTPKEMGENLMIVDLIRHDLQLFTDDVTVDALMAVEEYKTVYQMVSVIRGHIKEDGHKGVDILRLSLPPGSMTGAPKKRSIELLQDIESLQPTMMAGGRRGLYSGVAGYWSITDDADWSVTIRSIVNYKTDKENSPTENIWRIGAGGAITVLSDQEGEWDEMHVKLSSTLQTFL